MFKTIALILVSIVLLTNFSVANAQGALPIDNPGELQNAALCGGGGDIKDCVLSIFSIVFKALIYVAGAFAVISFIWAGVSLILKPDFTVAKDRLIFGAVGLIIALVSYVVVQIIARFVTETGAL